MTSRKRKHERELEPYLTPEELEEFIDEFSGRKLRKGTVREIAIDGNLLNEDGRVGVYEMLAFMAMYVK